MEIIRFGTPSNRPPLLFVHGSYCGAWIWQDFFLPAFAKAGWHGAAISLRGHGQSEGRDELKTFGLSDYLSDIAAGAALFNTPPVLIGHSMGGYLVQKYALDSQVSGLVLLSSPSLLGLSGSAQHIALLHPALAVELGKLVMFGPEQADIQIITDAFFNDSEAAKNMQPRLVLIQGESPRFSLEASWPELRAPRSRPPTLVLGGDQDAFVPVTDFYYEAAFWQTEAQIIPGASHGVMLDSCWPEVFRKIEAWLTKTYIKKPMT